MRFSFKTLSLTIFITSLLFADNSLELQNVDFTAGTLDMYMIAN